MRRYTRAFANNRGAAINPSRLPFTTPVVDPAKGLVSVFNALIARQPAAMALLAQHAGRTFHVCVSGLTVALTICHDGSLAVADSAVVADVTLRIDVGQLLRSGWVPGRPWPDQPGLLHVSGDAAMAQTLSTLARHWRPELEDILADRIGDVAAVRVVRGVAGLVKGIAASGSKLSQNLAEYLAYETRTLTPQALMQPARQQLAQHTEHIKGLENRLDQIRRRLDSLESLADQKDGPGVSA